MDNLFIVIVSGTTLLIALLMMSYSYKTRRLAKQKNGVLWLKALRNVLAGMQQHRGVSTGVLKGDTSLTIKLQQLQENIAQYIDEVESVDAWIVHNESWSSIVSHWQRLSERYSGLEVENNLVQHGKIIQNLLYLIEEMAEEHDLLNIKNIHDLGYDFIWKDLLETTEYMGQARAIGTGVAAAGVCGSVDKIRLNYLKEKIQLTTNRIWEKMPHSAQSKSAVTFLLSCLETKILQHQPMMNAGDYFAYATNAIDSLYSEYDKILKDFNV